MKVIFKKTVGIFLVAVILLSLFTLTSCNRGYVEEDVISSAATLLKEAELLNMIYYGSGIEYYDSNDATGYYRKANIAHLEELGFSTIDELKALTEKTFSDAYTSLLYTTVLSALSDDTGIVRAARYYQAYDEETNEPTFIMVYSAFNPMLKDTIEYDYDSLRVEKAKKERVYVKVDATVTNSEGKSQRVTLTVTLIEEADGWKIDNPTYANYNEAKDRYDELKDQDIK
jgi:hypothetical protein